MAPSRRVLVIAAALAAGSLVGVANPVEASPTASFLSGSVADGRGATVPGADVMLYAWPSQAVLSKLRPGQTVPMKLVQQTRSDSRGRYALVEPSVASVASAASASGDVNFDVVTVQSGATSSYSFSRSLRPGSPMSVAAPLAARATSNLTLPTGPNSVVTAHGVFRPLDNPTSCRTSFVQDLGIAWAIVGQTYSTSASVNHAFVYTSGSSSSLGIGVSSSGNFGTFTAGGTSSTSSSATITFPEQVGRANTYYRTMFQYGKFKTNCTWHGGSSVSYSARATGFAGGASLLHPGLAPNANQCTPFVRGASFQLNKTTAIQWANGVNTAGLLGINLSAQTGYSTQAEVKYSFRAAAALCGVNTAPGGSNPSQIVAK